MRHFRRPKNEQARSLSVELYTLPSGVPYNVSGYAINSAGSGPAAARQQVIPK